MAKKKEFHFAGFDSPNTTPVPDGVFDELLSCLGEAELKVLLYIIRRTFGFKKKSDSISLKQLSGGIVKKDGEILDKGTGLSRKAVWKATSLLTNKGIIKVDKSISEKGDMNVNTYRLRFKEDG